MADSVLDNGLKEAIGNEDIKVMAGNPVTAHNTFLSAIANAQATIAQSVAQAHQDFVSAAARRNIMADQILTNALRGSVELDVQEALATKGVANAGLAELQSQLSSAISMIEQLAKVAGSTPPATVSPTPPNVVPPTS